MASLVKPNPNGIVVPKRFIKEEVDRAHRQDWEDPERYLRQKQKALQYIPVRAPGLLDVDRLVREVTRVFHDELINDPEVIEAAQRAVWAAQPSADIEEISVATDPADPARGDVRGLDDLDDQKLLDLDWQRYEEEHEP